MTADLHPQARSFGLAWSRPRQQTNGGKPRLNGITKRSYAYLRKLLIHGARAAMIPLSGTHTALGPWRLRARAHVTLLSWHLRTSWHGSPGRCCALGHSFDAREAAAVALEITGKSTERAEPARTVGDVCGWWE